MATTITANGINFPDGSAGSPSIGGTDTNTGLFTGSDIVGFATGGSERLRIDASGNINIANDSGKLQLGTSADLKLYHDGTNSVLSNATGTLYYLAGTQQIMNLGGTETMAKFTENGAAELYYDNGKKFETTSAGAQLFGNLTVGTDGGSIFLSNPDGFSPRLQENAGSLEFYTNNSLRMSLGHGGNLLFQDNRKAEFGANSDLQIYHDSSHARIKNATGHIVISSNSLDITNAADSENLAKFDHDGSVKLYYDNSQKFETISDGVRVTDYIKFSGANCGIDFGATSNNTGMSSEVLDDYEEGTWTPTYLFDGSDTATYTARSGYYTKIGNLVFAKWSIDISARGGSGSGRLDIGGLPFSIADKLSSTGQEVGGMITYWNNTAPFNLLSYWGQNGESVARVTYTTGDGNNSIQLYVNRGNLNDDSGMRGFIFYNAG